MTLFQKYMLTIIYSIIFLDFNKGLPLKLYVKELKIIKAESVSP